jgi:membrane protein DedA with SNARE-associated domain
MLSLSALSDTWIYLGILVAAIIEGEIAYIAAAALVAQGRLNPLSVVVAGALGAAIGDQAFFYVFRGRLPRWMARFPTLERKTAPLLDRVRQHSSLMVLLVRFAPGLRIAITAACAWIDVPALRFSLLNLVSSFVWAVALLGLVGWLGPAYLARIGLGGWKGAALTGLLVLALFKALGKYEARVMDPVAAERT